MNTEELISLLASVKLQCNAEKQRADDEKQRADDEKQRADAAETQLKAEKLRADAAEERANAAEERANAAVQTACNLLISLDRYVTSSPSVALALTCRGEHKLTWLPPFGY